MVRGFIFFFKFDEEESIAFTSSASFHDDLRKKVGWGKQFNLYHYLSV